VVPLLRGGDDDAVRVCDRTDDTVLLAANEELLQLPSLPRLFGWGTFFVGASIGATFLR
jgi:hypothetical protein